MVADTVTQHSELRDWIPVAIQFVVGLIFVSRLWEKQASHEKADGLKHAALDKKNDQQDARMDDIEDDIVYNGERLVRAETMLKLEPLPVRRSRGTSGGS